jgi:hypothetical protein|tara:strand:- start:316 stop:528 length:213 start_codon:yes stop_codon:yes gene_type:complete
MHNFESTKGRNMEKLNYEWVKGLGSFCGVKLRGNETFDELLKIEKDNQERIKRDEANIQRVDAQTKGVKW